jgi:DNA-binding transcriptional LysR family regulator
MRLTMPWDERIKRRLKLRDLDILMTVVQSGSMGKAADRLSMFQPTISKSIADLEHTLGVRLLDRKPQGIEPTPYALALIGRSAAAFNELKQGVQEIDNLADPTSGELRIAGTEPVMAGLFPAVIERLSKQYPRFVFHVTQISTDLPQYRALRERDVELIVGRLPPLVTEDDLKVDNLFDDPLIVAAGVQNRWTNRRKIDLAELVDELWVLPPSDKFIGGLFADIFHSCGLDRPKSCVVCRSLHMNDALLATGRYLAIYSASRLQLSAKRLSIKVLPVKLPAQSSRVGIVTLKNRTLSPIAQLFINNMREVVAALSNKKSRQ